VYDAFNAYRRMGVITDSSILTYSIGLNGMLDPYNTSKLASQSIEQFQHSLTLIDIPASPCIFCDETIGACKNLGTRLQKLYDNQDNFMQDSVNRATKYRWSGYTLDIEPVDYVNGTKLTTFVLEWADYLQKYDLVLSVWIGGDTVYGMDRLYGGPNNLQIFTMETYTSTYVDFIKQANLELISINNASRLGFGLLTSISSANQTLDHEIDQIIGSINMNGKNSMRIDNKVTDLDFMWMSESDIGKVVDWVDVTKAGSMSIWATHIPPAWYAALKRYVGDRP
jgi:hypothetical protein